MADAQVLTAAPVQRRRIVVRGVVQGVGFRPFVARLAADLRLSGLCGNDAVSVFVEAEGSPDALDELCHRIESEAPPLSLVLDLRSEPLPPRGDSTFEIVPSRTLPGARTLVAPDVATCADCLREMADPGDRRFRHPFITCTSCGPRFTIIEDLPYDRPATTMAAFEMCARCRAEYVDPGDRRHHAQPVSCHDCGPRLWVETAGHSVVDGDDAALSLVQRTLADGGVVAVKGIGGFHLACDATDPGAVARLRERKHRPGKPFAVMGADVATVTGFARVSPAEQSALTQPARPIVLLRKAAGSTLADGIAPGLDEVGAMLPYTPLHHLLFDRVPGSGVEPPRILVMTSGNLSDEPLCSDNQDARDRLSRIADVYLMHDRKIAVPCDDSVVAVWEATEVPVRRSRGFAPLPVALADSGPVTLAVGAEVKNTFCLTRDDFAFCSGHLGDMGSLESQQAFGAAVAQLTTLHAAIPQLVVADDHPGYATRHWAERYSQDHDVPLVTVQHHHAHVASLLAEHGLLGTPVLGVAFDGTGYGCDRTVWGGELLYVGADVTHIVRAGHLEAFPLPGGDRAVRHPFRVALALLHAAGLTDADGLADAHGLHLAGTCPAREQAVVRAQLVSGTGCVPTTSVGRLFDGVASLLGVRHQVSYEAQAAIELEALARSATSVVPLPMEVADGELKLERLVRAVVDGVRAGRPVAGLALGFHDALATATAELVLRAAREHDVTTVGLTGGVFQNRLLLGALADRLRAAGLIVLTHQRVPANDGGLSLGQAVVGRARAMRLGAAQRGLTATTGGGQT
ncbi:MAG TPA: carbamoyltransferase HypF [Nocardioidaceae bacterium]|nr:carbamoyltransferase HypF [Nocardioidaceae bacterium]